MKKRYVTDVFRFSTWNPAYDEVDEKLRELKDDGWTKLEYEKGINHIGRDPYDEDYTRNATIRGVRLADKEDIKQIIKQTKAIIERGQKEVLKLKEDRDDYVRDKNDSISIYINDMKKEQKLLKELEGDIK